MSEGGDDVSGPDDCKARFRSDSAATWRSSPRDPMVRTKVLNKMPRLDIVGNFGGQLICLCFNPQALVVGFWIWA